jgi:hypothetical protein
MEYKLYTLVDITNTGQHRPEAGKEQLHWKEQNFQTVMQTLGMRANVVCTAKPVIIETSGNVVGFDNITEIVRVWRMDFATTVDDIYSVGDDPVEALREDFEMVPFISGLDEAMTAKYNAFLTYGNSKNIVFFKK